MMPNVDLISNLEDISSLNREEGCLNDLLFLRLRVQGSQLNLLPDILFEKFLGVEKIVFIVLF